MYFIIFLVFCLLFVYFFRIVNIQFQVATYSWLILDVGLVFGIWTSPRKSMMELISVLFYEVNEYITNMSSNKRIALIFGGFVTAVAVAFYPIFFHPLAHTEDYSKCLSWHFISKTTFMCVNCSWSFHVNALNGDNLATSAFGYESTCAYITYKCTC